MTELNKYPEQIQNVIKSAKKMTRQDLINYFNDQIKYYDDYNKNNPNMDWANSYSRNYTEKKVAKA